MIFSFNKFVPKQAREKFFLNFFFPRTSKVLKFLQKLSSHSHKKKPKKKTRERERGLKAKHHKIHQRELRVCVCVIHHAFIFSSSE
jgi:nitrogenase molybdenum-iron protein alpha/beta subunit